MSAAASPRVAVVGAGETGRGWAALCAGFGWQVAIYDPESAALQQAPAEIAARAQRLVELGRAEREIASNALHALRVGRSLLHAVTDADWIIEASTGDAAARQRLLEQVEGVARRAAVTTSCSATLHASDLAVRLRRPERFLVLHPLDPIELLPLVEVVPSPRTDPDCTEDVRHWLLLLRRVPVVLAREVPGHAVGRIGAAVWREAAHLVLDGVLDVQSVDRVVALGPALAWAAAGPYLTAVLASGGAADSAALGAELQTLQAWWSAAAPPRPLDLEEQGRVIRAIERAYADRVADLRAERDRRLARLVDAVREGL